jgi:hypothetical protein
MLRWRSHILAFALAAAASTSLSSACSGAGLSKDRVKPFVALSLASDAELHLAAFTGTFCESDEGRRLRLHPNVGGAVPSNAHAFGRMADDPLLKKLAALGYVDLKEETLSPDAAEASHPACGKREICARCPVISKYYVATYRLTPKGKDLFLVTPVTEEDFTSLYNSGPLTGPLDDVQQEFSDDMPLRISVVVATKAFDVTGVATDSANKIARVAFDWYWKPAPRLDKTTLQLIPQGRNHASLQLKLLEDGWHLERDVAPPPE